MKSTAIPNNYERLKKLLIKTAGQDIAAQLTDENIAQFDDILTACAEIIYSRMVLNDSNNGIITRPD